MIVDRLERQVWALTQPREGKPLHEPERGFHGHWVVLVNEDTGSAGEWFATEIQSRGLAPIIGMRTWGGAVGIELHQPLIDGGATTPPQFAPYGLNGKWLIEGVGVVPDLEVQNMPADVLRGKDTQLETCVSYIMDELHEDPKELPPRPSYPDKSKN
jgi:tricorn protease